MNTNIKQLIESLFDDDLFNDDTIEDKVNLGKIYDEFVDLGLPSGTLWARENLGYENTNHRGLFYQWGDVTGYRDELLHDFDCYGYKFARGKTYFSKYCTKLSLNRNKDSKKILDLEDDAAYQINNDMYIPTVKQCQELINNCNISIYKLNGTIIAKFKSKINGEYIEFPLVGFQTKLQWRGLTIDGIQDVDRVCYLWTNEIVSRGKFNTINANCLSINVDTTSYLTSCSRWAGLSIRPVMDKN